MKGLAEARTAAAYTQVQLAERLGVRQSTVAMWESGKACPRANMLPAIADALGCTIDALFDAAS